MTEPTPLHADAMLAAAIDAVEAEPSWPAMAEIPVLISSSQRPAMLLLPADVTDTEIAELAA